MDSTLLGYLGQSPVALVNVTTLGAETVVTTLTIQPPGGKVVSPASFIPTEPYIPTEPVRPYLPGLFIALIPGNPI